jgi:endonuclease YncB( thermonuclease family)
MAKILVIIAAALGILYAWQVSTGRAPWTSELIESGTGVPVDGDSIRVNGKEIRLRGIDAPEYAQTCERSGRDVACGRESAAALRRQLARGPVTCVGGERDRYGRLLAQCRIMGADIAAWLVREGHAISFGDYLAEEAEARNDNRGLWSGKFETPREWRAKHPRSPPPVPGDASRSGSPSVAP